MDGETHGPVGPDVPFTEHTLTAMRRVTATRLQQAKQTVPHFYLRIECVVDAALGRLARVKELHPDVTPSLTDFVVWAAALALRQVPQANSTWADGVVRVYDTVDIAVAVNTPKGLITPIVRAADRKDLGAIARETRALVTRAREGTLTPEEYTGGTFTVSNLGMYGVEGLYAIVNPPQSCILGVGAAVKRPVVAGNVVTVGTVMTCTLSADHRAIDGAVGAELLAALRAFIEQPGLMALSLFLSTEGPDDVGADRLVNAISAHQKYGGPLIVVDFGTAPTFDVIDADGNYVGGVIAPGVNLSLEALHMAAAQLPRVGIQRTERVIGKSTVEAMQSGIYWGYVSMIEGLVRRLSEEHGAEMEVIATGGLAKLFTGATDCINHSDPDLILRGLLALYRQNS